MKEISKQLKVRDHKESRFKKWKTDCGFFLNTVASRNIENQKHND